VMLDIRAIPRTESVICIPSTYDDNAAARLVKCVSCSLIWKISKLFLFKILGGFNS
jgi:hypothetical protein